MCKKIENRIRAKLEEKNEDSKISKDFNAMMQHVYYENLE